MIKLKVDENQPIILKVADNTTATMSVEESIVAGGAANLQTKNVEVSPSEAAVIETVFPDAGYDGMSQVNIDVLSIPSNYVGSMIPRRSSSDLTVSGDTVTAPSGYYQNSASKAVASNDFIITLSKDGNDDWIVDKTFSEITTAYGAGKIIRVVADPNLAGAYPVDGYYDSVDAVMYYYISSYAYDSGTGTDYIISDEYYQNSSGLHLSTSVDYYNTWNADATAADLLSGKVAYSTNGKITGTATARTSSDLSASGGTVTAPAGFYSSAATYTFPNANGEDF